MNTTETTKRPEQTRESRTETMLDGSLINYVLIGPTGVRIYRKGGGSIDVTSGDQRRELLVNFINVERASLDK